MKTAKRSIVLLTALFVLAGCYEPADLTPVDEVEMPCVYCVLGESAYVYGDDLVRELYEKNPDPELFWWEDYVTVPATYETPDAGYQYLQLSYLSSKGNVVRYEDNAKVKVEMRGDPLTYTIPFENIGNGIYRSVHRGIIESGLNYDMWLHLQVCLPNGDTLTADTMSSPHPSSFAWQDGTWSFDSYIKTYAPLMEEDRLTEFHLDGEHYAYHSVSPPEDSTLFYQDDRTCFVLPASNAPIWAYKVSWSGPGQDDWSVEDEITTSLDSRVDAFNQTGKTYQGHTLLAGPENYPELLGRPLHHRYLRFSPSPQSDTLTISGNFSGLHYGCTGKLRQKIYSAHLSPLLDKIRRGDPYLYNAITMGRAGYIVFKIVSPEYDRYLKEVTQYELGREVSTDIIGIYQNTNSYTNIKGGVGIFGVEDVYKYYWTNGTWNL